MNWIIVFGIIFLWQYGLQQIAIKKIGAKEGSRTRKLVWQYAFAALFALIAATIFGERFELTWSVAGIMVIGMFNAFGCYCHWRAYDISMARTGVTSTLDDGLAILLGYFFLNELKVLTPSLVTGILISLICVIAFAQVKKSNEKGESNNHFTRWVIGYTFTWGIAMFSIRWFNLQGLSMLTYVAAWYSGSWLGALFTRHVLTRKTNEAGAKLEYKLKLKVAILGMIIWTSMMLGYWMYSFLPITVLQPIRLVAEMSIPTLIGLFLFKEIKTMSRKEIILIAGGLIGVAVIASSF